MKICLKKVNNMSCCKEFNLIICADGCIGRRIRRSLPKCICGDGIKINIIVTGCDGVLEAPALPCNDLIAISSPIKVIRKNPCCKEKHESCCNNFDMDDFNFGVEEFNDECNMMDSFIPETFAMQEFAIIVRSFNPVISQFLCEFPQMFITDCDNTVKLIIIFDKNGSVFAQQNNCGCNCGGCCGFNGGCGCGGGFGFNGGCGFGGGCGCGFGGGCGCGFGGFFGLAALALLFCC